MIYLNNLKRFAIISAILTTLIKPECALSYSIHDAIIDAHENNYSMMAQLETLRSAEMDKPIAIADFMPRGQLQQQASKTDYRYANAANSNRQNSHSRTLTLTQPIFNGGATVAKYMQADSNISAAEASFKDASAQISRDVGAAYESVVSNQNILQLSIENLNVAKETLEYTQTRFEHGEVTKTDVLQAESSLADAVASKEQAIGNLEASKATLERIIGHKAPEKLDKIEYNKLLLPATLDEVIDFALKHNYQLMAAKFQYDSSKYDVMSKASSIMPSISAQAQLNRATDNKNSSLNPSGNTYGITLTIPIAAQGGAEYAQIAKSQYASNSARYSYMEAERKVRENAINSWSTYRSQLAQLKSKAEAIVFYEKALEGVREEAKVGTRTTLDVLTAQNSLFKTQVDYKATEQNLINSIYTLLYIMSIIETVDVRETE